MRRCDYYAAGDRDQFEMYFKEHGEVESWRPLFTTEREDDDRKMPSHAIKLKPYHVNGRKRFSLDLREGVYLNNTIASYGIQLAVWMLGDSGTWGAVKFQNSNFRISAKAWLIFAAFLMVAGPTSEFTLSRKS
jgi:hypothetical protein